MNDKLDMRLYPPPPRPSALARAWSGMVGRVGAISPDETSVRRRRFKVDDPVIVARLEDIGLHFVAGYNFAVGVCDLDELTAMLDQAAGDNAGFVHEGAAMGLAIGDFMTPCRRLFARYIAGPGHRHEYMAWVGLGWALARLPVAPERALAGYSNLHCWLALDGYGFHEGYFHWPQRIDGQRRPRGLSADGQHVFDQGLGRSMWFVQGADPQRVAACIGALAPGRHADLWAGVGLAAAYAGAARPQDYGALLRLSATHACALAQGVVFAAQARLRAGNPVPHLEQATRAMLALDAADAAAIALGALPSSGHGLASYQAWRYAIQRRCAQVAPHLLHPDQGER
jgi:hypothetical protein